MEAKVGGLVGPGEATWDRHLPGSQVGTKQGRECQGHGLTHPHLSEAALAQLDLQPQRLPGDLPGVFGQALSLRLASAPGRRAGAPPLWQLAGSFPVTLPWWLRL